MSSAIWWRLPSVIVSAPYRPGIEASGINRSLLQQLKSEYLQVLDANFTPARLATIYPTISSECWRCGFSRAGAEHIFWECSHIKPFWERIVLCISDLLKIPIPNSIKVCLVGLVDEVVPSMALRTLLNILFFYGRKAILLKWRSSVPPGIPFWKGLVNSMLP